MRITVTGKEKGERSRWGENSDLLASISLWSAGETSPHLSNLQESRDKLFVDHGKNLEYGVAVPSCQAAAGPCDGQPRGGLFNFWREQRLLWVRECPLPPTSVSSKNRIDFYPAGFLFFFWRNAMQKAF